MGIIIRNVDNIYYLESISHTPVNFTPFTKPEAIQNFCMCMKIGKLKDLDGLEIDKEYPDLDCYKNFEVVERISQVKHKNGLVYDDLTFKRNMSDKAKELLKAEIAEQKVIDLKREIGELEGQITSINAVIFMREQEIKEICPHTRKKTKHGEVLGDYYNKGIYFTVVNCLLCGEELERTESPSSYG